MERESAWESERVGDTHLSRVHSLGIREEAAVEIDHLDQVDGAKTDGREDDGNEREGARNDEGVLYDKRQQHDSKHMDIKHTVSGSLEAGAGHGRHAWQDDPTHSGQCISNQPLQQTPETVQEPEAEA